MLTRLATAPIRFYRRYISGLKATPSCRFLPTCSAYALEAVETRGVLIGGWKALWRILRCNPLCRGGYDPVDGVPESRRCLHAVEQAPLDLAQGRPFDFAQDRHSS